jgi:hypothetical protein
MKNSLLRTFNSLKAIVKPIAIFLVTIVMLLNLMPSVAAAEDVPRSRTPLGTEGDIEEISDQDYEAAKEKRQEWQRKASSIRQKVENKPTTLREKLNVDELAKGYQPEREADKRSVSTP